MQDRIHKRHVARHPPLRNLPHESRKYILFVLGLTRLTGRNRQRPFVPFGLVNADLEI